MYRKMKATTMNARLQATEGALISLNEEVVGTGDGARHLPRIRTASGAKRVAVIAPCRKSAVIIPWGNLSDRKNTDSTWEATVEMPYIPSQMAPTSGHLRHLDRKIKYDKTIPAQMENVRKAPRKFC